LAEEVEEGAVVADDRTVPLDDRGEHVVVVMCSTGLCGHREVTPLIDLQIAVLNDT
jgi:hypothetical protein